MPHCLARSGTDVAWDIYETGSGIATACTAARCPTGTPTPLHPINQHGNDLATNMREGWGSGWPATGIDFPSMGSVTPGGGVPVQGNSGGNDQSPGPMRSTVPPENLARRKSTVPPENLARRKSTVPLENLAPLKSTPLPEN